MTSKIIVADSLEWLDKQSSIQTIVTSIPDLDETSFNKDNYINFFKNAVKLLFEKVKPREYIVLMQTDRKINGEWIDKSYLVNDVASDCKIKLLWHKIIKNRDGTFIQRPTYTHLLAYSKYGTPGKAFPDVLSSGQHLYNNGSSPNATCYVMRFLQDKGIYEILDPFCGMGTIPFIASLFKINSIGIDIDPKQCEYAKKIHENKKMMKIVMDTDYYKLYIE